MLEWIVPPDEAGKKLIQFLSQRLEGKYSARYLKRAIEENLCQFNGRTERFASTIIAKGDHIVFKLESTTPIPLKKTHSIDPSRILYEDKDLLIYNKESGINCDKSGILLLLQKYNPALQLIHRLDRDTTGALLLAKSPSVFAKMVEEFKNLRVEKCYVALVDGILEKKHGSIDNYLGKKHIYQGQTIWGEVDKKDGLHAHTDWKKIEEGKRATLLFCYPKTGRTHQIRVHLAGIGHPILGDFQYCKRFNCSYKPPRYLLHAYALSFIHPITGKKIDIEVPLPEDFKVATKELFGNDKFENK
ncbi:MAG: RluA family pseudouridine synthase [Parachlamydiaceae bacterium]|nr:RluA family pseudouridine synthase [Parachlamydiaceae bacterium]